MAKILHCRDVGFDCEGVIEGETEEEVLEQAAEHARTVHGMTEIDEATVETIRAAIRDA